MENYNYVNEFVINNKCFSSFYGASNESGDMIQFCVEVSIFMSDGGEIRRHLDMAGLTSGIMQLCQWTNISIGQIYPGNCS